MKKFTVILVVLSTAILACPMHIKTDANGNPMIDTEKNIVTLVPEKDFTDCEEVFHKKNVSFTHKINKDYTAKLFEYKSYDVYDEIIKAYDKVDFQKTCKIDFACTN